MKIKDIEFHEALIDAQRNGSLSFILSIDFGLLTSLCGKHWHSISSVVKSQKQAEVWAWQKRGRPKSPFVCGVTVIVL
jgi:hypothetical protein